MLVINDGNLTNGFADAAADIYSKQISNSYARKFKNNLTTMFGKTDSKKLRSPLLIKNEYLSINLPAEQIKFLRLKFSDFNNELSAKIKSDQKLVLVIETDNEHAMAELRRFFFELISLGIKNPVIIKRDYENHFLDDVRLYSSTDFGGLLIDGFGDGVWLKINSEKFETEKGQEKEKKKEDP
jgi:(E)-4-hydroxy-3-methylbut-2-enyl-diphosphate synthase